MKKEKEKLRKADDKIPDPLRVWLAWNMGNLLYDEALELLKTPESKNT